MEDDMKCTSGVKKTDMSLYSNHKVCFVLVAYIALYLSTVASGCSCTDHDSSVLIKPKEFEKDLHNRLAHSTHIRINYAGPALQVRSPVIEIDGVQQLAKAINVASVRDITEFKLANESNLAMSLYSGEEWVADFTYFYPCIIVIQRDDRYFALTLTQGSCASVKQILLDVPVDE